jgi:hypothetical protein
MATTFDYWSYEYYKTQSPPSLSSAATTLRKNLPQIDRE